MLIISLVTRPPPALARWVELRRLVREGAVGEVPSSAAGLGRCLFAAFSVTAHCRSLTCSLPLSLFVALPTALSLPFLDPSLTSSLTFHHCLPTALSLPCA